MFPHVAVINVAVAMTDHAGGCGIDPPLRFDECRRILKFRPLQYPTVQCPGFFVSKLYKYLIVSNIEMLVEQVYSEAFSSAVLFQYASQLIEAFIVLARYLRHFADVRQRGPLHRL
jgi:hypothetical protein